MPRIDLLARRWDCPIIYAHIDVPVLIVYVFIIAWNINLVLAFSLQYL